MRFICWIREIIKSCFENSYLKRRWSFGSGNESNQDTPPPGAARGKRTIAELAIPAALCFALYGSIPPDIHQDHRTFLLYEPLVACICLAVFVSLSAIIYALANPDGDAAVEATKHKAMAFSVGVLLVAFVLRILLLLSVASIEFFSLLFLCFAAAAVVVAALCFLPLTVGQSSTPVAGEPAPDYPVAVENQV